MRAPSRSVLAVLVIAGTLGVTALLSLRLQKSTSTCPARSARPWAAAAFAERMAAMPLGPWPSLTAHPVPTYTNTVTADAVRLNFENRPVDPVDTWKLYERVDASGEGPVSLPHEPGLSLELITWRMTEGPWLDPGTGEPMDFPAGRNEVESERCGFCFRLSAPEAAKGDVRSMLRLHGATLFDRTTGVELNDGAAWSFGGDWAYVGVTTTVLHRADLMLELPVTYGLAESRALSLVTGEVMDFAGDARLQIEHVGRGEVNGWGTSDRSSSLHIEPNGPDATNTFAAFYLWPPVAMDRLIARVPGTGPWNSPFSSRGLDAFKMDSPAVTSMEVRFLPHLARIQFALPPPATLPEVSNLFELVPKRWAEERGEVENELASMLQVDLDELRTYSRDPLEIAPGTTAGEVLRVLLHSSTDPEGLDYDPTAFTVTAPSVSMVTRLLRRLRSLFL